MKRIILLYVLCLFMGSAYAQQESELSITGSATLSLKPTKTVVAFTVRSTQNSYVAAVEDMTKRVDELAGILSKLKFREDQIITSTFSIEEKFLYDRGQKRNDGYVSTQVLRVSFPQDKKRLLDVLSKTTSGLVNAEIGIAFALDEAKRSAVELQLIEMAVQDAKKKAEIISAASGYTITGVKDISYGAAPVNFPQSRVSRVESLSFASEANGVDVSNFEAADLTFSDNVSIVYWIGRSK